jgi:mono/diheme cytochrome c family protein
MNERPAGRGLGGILMLVVFLSVTAPPVFAAGNSANGLKLARQWCASCHAVDSEGTMTDSAPSFPTLAKRRDKTWVRAWLSDPHPPMKGIDLSRAQIDDVTAYLTSLPSN